MAPTDAMRDDDVLAAELALGVLEGGDLAEARRRLVAEPDFARAVERWRDHFAVLALQTPDLAPPPALAARLAAAVRSQQRGTVTAIAPPRPARRWRAVVWAGGGAIAAALMLVLIARPLRHSPAAADELVAALDVPATHATLLARLDAGGQLRIAGAVAVPPAHDAQLWLIAGSASPRSLGLLRARADRRWQAAPAAGAALAAGATLAISIEPAGGSPTGLPTGPVVASGVIRKI